MRGQNIVTEICGLNTFVDGEGEPILFLHGYGSSKESFYYQLEYFSQFFKVYCPDLPGFKTPLSYAFSLDDYCDVVRSFIAATGERFSVVAHSFGARIVLKMSPYDFKKIVLTGPAGLKPKRNVGYYLKKWGYKSIKTVFGEKSAKKFSAKFNKSGIESMPVNNRLSFIKIVNEHLDYKLKTITAPTLIVEGDDDKETPMYMAKRFQRGIKNCELVTIKGGHFAFIDDYLSFNIIVKDFLTE